jgi:protein-tyrosine phosphatase
MRIFAPEKVTVLPIPRMMKTLGSKLQAFMGLKRNSEDVEGRNLHFVDIHTHIIPAIDDGPSDTEGVLRMLRIAYQSGTREVVATPHMFLDLFDNTDSDVVKEQFERIVAELRNRSTEPEHHFLQEMSFYLGAENYISHEFLKAQELKRVLTLNESRYLLVESSPYLSIIQLSHTLERIVRSDLTPVIAHPERHWTFQDAPERLRALLEKGCLVQVNAGSILGISGRRTRKAAMSMLRKGLVHVIASDGHGTTSRPQELGTVFHRLLKRFSPAEVKSWLFSNPSSIVRNLPPQQIPARTPEDSRKAGASLSRPTH